MNAFTLAEEIINGRRITREDDLSFFLTCDLEAVSYTHLDVYKRQCRNRQKKKQSRMRMQGDGSHW